MRRKRRPPIILTTCSTCGDVEISSEIVEVRVLSCSYNYNCPICGNLNENALPVGADAVAILKSPARLVAA